MIKIKEQKSNQENIVPAKYENTPKSLGFYMPAEWEKQEAVWLTWPKSVLTWPGRILLVQGIYIQMIEVITSYQKVNLLVDDEKAESIVRDQLAKAKISVDNVKFWHIPTVDAWIRDYGPTFVIGDRKNGSDKIGMIDWTFNAWGNKYEELIQDTAVPKKINEKLKISYFNPSLVLEGGSIEVDGEGTVLITEQCLLNKNRNPNLNRKAIEDVLIKYLNVEKVLWLGSGIEGDDTDGHIDDIARFVSPGVVVVCSEDDETDINHAPLKENFLSLSSMKDAKNRSLSVVKLPLPEKVIGSNNKQLPASYANFLITNKAVLVPIFGKKNDDRALSILKEVFPSRDIIGFKCDSIIWGMGAIHCLSQQQPSILKF